MGYLVPLLYHGRKCIPQWHGRMHGRMCMPQWQLLIMISPEVCIATAAVVKAELLGCQAGQL